MSELFDFHRGMQRDLYATYITHFYWLCSLLYTMGYNHTATLGQQFTLISCFFASDQKLSREKARRHLCDEKFLIMGGLEGQKMQPIILFITTMRRNDIHHNVVTIYSFFFRRLE